MSDASHDNIFQVLLKLKIIHEAMSYKFATKIDAYKIRLIIKHMLFTHRVCLQFVILLEHFYNNSV